MTPHTKIATIVAPFLLIGGYIAADYYQTAKEESYMAEQAKTVSADQLQLQSPCRMPVETCVLQKDDLVLTMKADSNYYYLDSSIGLDGVTIGLAQSDRVTRGIMMQRLANANHWKSAIRSLSNLQKDKPLVMRVAVASGDKRYYAEFEITTSGPWGEQ